jgi:hypothetical protein
MSLNHRSVRAPFCAAIIYLRTGFLCMRDRFPYGNSVPNQTSWKGGVPAGFQTGRRLGHYLTEQARLVCAGSVLLCLSLVSAWPATRPSSATAAVEPQTSVGISVQPPVLWIPDVKPGHEIEFPAPLTVKNRGTGSVTCKIVPIPADPLGIRSMPGYVDIPDPSWCSLERDAITLDAGEAKSVLIRLLVPDDPCYYNRHWVLAFSVRTTGGGTLGAAVYPYMYIETASGTEPIRPPDATGEARALSPESPRGTDAGSSVPGVSTRPASATRGCLIITPGTLDAGDVPTGRAKEAGSVSIRNELDQDILLSVRSVMPEPTRLARRVLLTPGHMWMRRTDWLRPATRALLVPAGEEARFVVTVTSPEDSTAVNYRWEGYIAINGSDGTQFLVRTRWRTTKASGETTRNPTEMTQNPSESEFLSGRHPQGEGP